MKRIYRVNIEVQAEFQRKVRIRTIQKELAARLKLPEPWKLAGVSSRSIAKPEVTPKAPDPVKVARDLARENVIGRLQAFADVMVRLAPGSTKRPRVHLFPTRWCGPQFNERMGRHSAHAHNDKRVMWGTTTLPNGRKKHTRLGVLWGLICINPKYVDRCVADPAFLETDGPELMAHELAHVRRTRGRHSKRQDEAEVMFLDLYQRWKKGELSLTEKRPPWAKNVEPVYDEHEAEGEHIQLQSDMEGDRVMEAMDQRPENEPTAEEEAQRRMREMEESERQSP